MKKQLTFLATLFIAIVIAGLGNPTTADAAIIVNSPRDVAVPDEGEVTIRSALASAADGESIEFAADLDGLTIELSLIDDEHTVLKGEVMGIREEPSGPVSYLVGYFDRDYGKSALYAHKNVVIDASALPSGITLAWVGGYENPARVLAVYGDLTMTNVTITGGKSVAEELPQPGPIDDYEQLSTRARGAGLAVWGVATLRNSTLYNNHCKRDSDVPARGRDAGVFGGGIYADIVDIADSVISGNSLWASGVSGGGVFTVGGAEADEGVSKIVRSTITGNGISGMLGYGGGVYSDGGGIGNAKLLELTNSTIARNLVDVTAALPLPFVYWRGGGVYMSNGYLKMQSCTVVENQVYGVPRTDALGKPNMAGGIAATIGNAHAVERMTIGHSVIAGNTVHPVAAYSGIPNPELAYEQDIFTGTLLHFNSLGHNRIGTIEFSHMLVPVGQTAWRSLSRKHYPKQGDEVEVEGGVILADVINLTSGITLSDTILSAGVDAPNPVVLHYEPKGNALDQVPPSAYSVDETYAEYTIESGATNNFLEIILGRIEDYYGLPGFAAGFTADFETFLADIDDETPGNQQYTDPNGIPILTLDDTQWFGPARTWPKEVPNYPYIEFWHLLDTELRDKDILGPELLGDAEWIELFSESTAPLAENPGILMSVWTQDLYNDVVLEAFDQLGRERPADADGDIGAYEHFSPPCSAPATEDECGECAGGDTGNQACEQDCNLDWGGTAYTDNCVFCVSGNTGLDACAQDCNGDWGGTAEPDDCGQCAGGETGIVPCTSPGTIIIVKQTDPAGETESFEFSTNYSSNFFLADGETNNSGNLLSDTYSVSEINTGNWSQSADCDNGNDPSAIYLDPGETVTCTFTNTKLSEMYTLSFGVTENGTIALNPPGGTYSNDTEVEVMATPAEGYEFYEWSGDLSGSTNPETITMDSDKTVTATFIEIPCLTLDARFDDTKTLMPGTEYYTDETYTLTSVPPQYAGSYMISTPYDESNRTDASDYLTFKMPEDGKVYVAIDRRVTDLPNWMAGFDNTGDSIDTSLRGQKYLKVHSHEFSAGDCVNFGANQAPGFTGGTAGNYIVFVDIADGPPVVNVEPADVTVAAGQNATFSITATGFLPLHYLWTLNGSSVGGDSPSITIPNVQLSDSGQVVCAVSDAFERDTWSRVATLTVLLPKGAACTKDSECASNKCRGKPGNMTCK